MSPILVASVALRIVAMAWSVVLLRRVRDWRMGFLTLMLGLMALRQALTLGSRAGSPVQPPTVDELPGVAVSVMALLCVVFLERMLRQRAQAEAALRARDAQLQHAQRLESVGRLAGGVAHDFNNLLTVVLGQGQVLLEHSASEEDRGRAQAVVDAALSGASLTRQLLAFGRKQVLRPRVVDVNETVSAMAGMVGSLLGEDVDLRVELAPAPACVVADPGQLEQVVMNLCVNARDAMVGGGRLRVRVVVTDVPGRSQPSPASLAAGRYVVVEVTDDGQGMDAEVLESAFEPFFTTKARDVESGLGLSTALGIVIQSGGDIAVESESGVGSCFRVFLPWEDAAVGEVDVPRDGLARASGGAATILVVEDETSVRELVVEVLRRAGHVVLSAAEAARGAEIAEARDGAIDLLLTDVILPAGSGPQLAKTLRLRWPGLRVLFMSGYAPDVVRRHGDLDSDPLIQKPFAPDELLRAVGTALSGAVDGGLGGGRPLHATATLTERPSR